MGKSCSKIILLILILAAWIVVTVRAKKTEEGIILTDAYKKQIMESAEWKKIFLHTENYPDILLEDLKRIRKCWNLSKDTMMYIRSLLKDLHLRNGKKSSFIYSMG